MKQLAVMLLTGAVFLIAACQGDKRAEIGGQEAIAESSQDDVMPQIKLTSSAFIHEGMIPARYTCDGDDISPEIAWSNYPKGTKSMALICDDPDAPGGTWVHWVAYNIPPADSSLSAKMLADCEQCLQGRNSWGNNSYGGPCPPGGTHRYFFKIYALDTMLDLEAGATKEKLLEAIEGHVLGMGELMGRYQRQD